MNEKLTGQEEYDLKVTLWKIKNRLNIHKPAFSHRNDCHGLPICKCHFEYWARIVEYNKRMRAE